jgi:hypothetical protein
MGPRTPQKNGKVDRKFQTLYGRIQAMLNGAGLEGELRDKVWAECDECYIFIRNQNYTITLKCLVKLEW